MKRIFLIAVCIALVFCLSGCDLVLKILPVREYKGTPLSSLSYKTINYMGGTSSTYLLDFNENTVHKTSYIPYNVEGQEHETTFICEFTDEAEREFINSVYSYGLFSIKKHYEPPYVVMDGGGWELVINYSDGTSKKSTGSNAGPRMVFKSCSIPLYLLTGLDILGGVPSSYYSPPSVDYSVSYSYKTNTYVGNAFIDVSRANYLWNGHEKSGVDLYPLATSDRDIRLLSGVEYTLGMYTANYNSHIGEYKHFDECVVMSYNLDPGLSGGKEVLRTKWFKNVKIPFEANRIYLVTLYFDNGDFVEYVFSTETLDQKIQYGEYHYNIYSKGQSVLMINSDGSFTLDPFDYFDESDREAGESTVTLCGKWAFENIDGAEYLVLTEEKNGERIVLEPSAMGLYLDFEKTTLDLNKYNLDGDPEEKDGRVDFTKY